MKSGSPIYVFRDLALLKRVLDFCRRFDVSFSAFVTCAIQTHLDRLTITEDESEER